MTETKHTPGKISARVGLAGADAERLVECWNACDGIDNPAELTTRHEKQRRIIGRLTFKLESMIQQIEAYHKSCEKEQFTDIDDLWSFLLDLCQEACEA